MKKCGKCNKDKPLDDFGIKNKKTGQRQAMCKLCHREYAKEHYQNNTSYYKDKAKRNSPGYREETRKIVLDYLRENPCVDCGNSDIRVLQFDHKEMVRGKGNRIGSFQGAKNRILEEIAKCDVRCANCHMIRTFEQMGWERI